MKFLAITNCGRYSYRKGSENEYKHIAKLSCTYTGGRIFRYEYRLL
jgi:hypothetical protein